MGLKRVGSGRCLALLPGEFRSKAPEQPHSAAAVSDQPRWPSPAEKGGGGSAARRPQETTRARGSGPAPALRLSSSHGSPPAAAGPGQEVPPPERRPRCHWLRSPSVPRGGTSCRGGPSRGGGTPVWGRDLPPESGTPGTRGGRPACPRRGPFAVSFACPPSLSPQPLPSDSSERPGFRSRSCALHLQAPGREAKRMLRVQGGGSCGLGAPGRRGPLPGSAITARVSCNRLKRTGPYRVSQPRHAGPLSKSRTTHYSLQGPRSTRHHLQGLSDCPKRTQNFLGQSTAPSATTPAVALQSRPHMPCT